MTNLYPRHKPSIKEDPSRIMLDAMLGREDAVERQERRGQAQMCSLGLIPKQRRHSDEEWAKMGVTFSPSGDELFDDATMPSGWKLVPFDDHDMWSYLVDANGRRRAEVFYKAASYDRRAHACLRTRYSTERHYPKDADLSKPGVIATIRVTDGGKDVLWESPPCEFRSSEGWNYYDFDPQMDAAIAWLNQNKPDWNLVLAYWGE